MEGKMYYPYLRGKRYELKAMCELMDKGIISDKVIPIVEPINAVPAFLKFMDIYVRGNRNIGVIQNPEYGTFLNEIESSKKLKYKKSYFSYFYDNICSIPVYILKKNNRRLGLLSVKQKSIAVCTDRDIATSIHDLETKYNIGKFLIPDERIFKREIRGTKILMADNFKKQRRNVDYIKSVDDFFSDDHLYFGEDSYKGFSDFSIVGKEYTGPGFAPYAVAIHMVYFDNDDKLRVHHFISDTNEDFHDTQGKVKEALKKLVKSPLINKSTYAYQEFKRFYESESHLNLGEIKKLSIMHHVEIMSRYLEERK
jgi:hypothetical protein